MPPIHQRPGEPGYPSNSRPVASTVPQSAVAVGHHRNDESWVEVSSHPSSSSVSSVGEEIVTTGLRVSSSYRPRRRRQQQRASANINATQTTPRVGPPATDGSSQEEYDETESEEDHFLTSSTENLVSPNAAGQVPPQQIVSQTVHLDSSDDDDDDGNNTALGRQPSEPFRPQPNAFSHPPSHLIHRHSTSSSTTQHGNRRPSFTRRSYARADRRNFMSPNYQADNDAALRASLSTLLRCAAAARSLPKDSEKELSERSGRASGSQPVALRFASERELMAPSPTLAPSQGTSQPPKTSSQVLPPPASVVATGEKVKRAATPPAGQKSPRATKKKKTVRSEDALISPTLMTWVVSAGVVVLVSVVSFGAGYVIGREVGRRETLSSFSGAGNMSAVSEGGSCGREAFKSSGGTLRKFRWGTEMARSIAA